MLIPRDAESTIRRLAEGYPVVAITGPRQSGKTTLVRALFGERPFVSLEDLDERELARDDPRAFLARFPDGAVLDEIQRAPDLFSYLQTRVDEDGRPGLFILTGSQQFDLLAGITQSLAGRVALVRLLPFSLGELQRAEQAPSALEDLLFQGLYPPIHDRRLDPVIWYGNYVRTYVERDVRQIINVQDLSVFQRFVRMCAGRCGQLLNLTSLGNDCGISHATARSWLSVLEASYLVYLLRPHRRSFGKRLVKSPKLYFYDPGLAARLLGIQEPDQLASAARRAVRDVDRLRAPEAAVPPWPGGRSLFLAGSQGPGGGLPRGPRHRAGAGGGQVGPDRDPGFLQCALPVAWDRGRPGGPGVARLRQRPAAEPPGGGGRPVAPDR